MQGFITDIKVNIAYDAIDDANLSQYEYFAKWLLDLKKDNERKFLQWLHLDYFLGNQFFTFNKNTLEYFHNSNEKFIYPILLFTNHLFANPEVELNDMLLQMNIQHKSQGEILQEMMKKKLEQNVTGGLNLGPGN